MSSGSDFMAIFFSVFFGVSFLIILAVFFATRKMRRTALTSNSNGFNNNHNHNNTSRNHYTQAQRINIPPPIHYYPDPNQPQRSHVFAVSNGQPVVAQHSASDSYHIHPYNSNINHNYDATNSSFSAFEPQVQAMKNPIPPPSYEEAMKSQIPT